jgi:hypothetical protein
VYVEGVQPSSQTSEGVQITTMNAVQEDGPVDTVSEVSFVRRAIPF